MKSLERRPTNGGTFLVLCLCLSLASTACRDTAKSDAPAVDASVAPAPSAARAEIPVVTAAAAPGPDDAHDALDAGADGGDGGAPRRRRLLVTADAGVPLETAP